MGVSNVMKVTVSPPELQVMGRLGPVCITCGNSRRFWIQTPAGEQLVELMDLPAGEVMVLCCGRCRSRNSIVIAHVD